MDPRLEPVRRLLAGEPIPRLTPALRRLAHALPSAAEEWTVESTSRVEELVRVLQERVWPEVVKRVEQGSQTGWPELIAGCLSAAEILRIDLPGAERVKYPTAIRSARQALEPPRVYVLLRGAPPTRVLMVRRAGDSAVEGPPWLVSCQRLAMELLGDEVPPRWKLAEPAEGTSQMAGLIMRCLMEFDIPPEFRSEAIGITGELNDEGALLPVTAVAEKVKRFFATHHNGFCFVPEAKWPELQDLRSEKRIDDVRAYLAGRSERLSQDQWQHLIPVRSVRELLVRLGLPRGHLPLARLFEQVRQRAEDVSDWRGTRYHASQLVELPLHDPGQRRDEKYPWSFNARESDLGSLVVAVRDGFGSRNRGLVLSGPPGAGKSMVLHRLYWELNAGKLRLHGPAVWLQARHLHPGQDLSAALAAELEGWTSDALRAVLDDPLVAGDVWLLVDGMDELPLPRRRALLVEVQRWPGPFVLATRRLRETEELPGTIMRVIGALDSTQRDAQFELLGRADLAEHLKDAPGGAIYGGGISSDGNLGFQRRPRTWALPPDQALLIELSQTPLGVSLIATSLKPGDLIPESRGQLLYGGMLHLIDRAEIEGRLDKGQRLLFTRLGIDVIGAAAWAMLRDGRAVLSIDDIDEALRERQVSSEHEQALHVALEASGFIQPVGPGEWEFSHKAFAEYCAARWLERRPDQQIALWSRLGEPGVDEIAVHLCTLSKGSARLLGQLLESLDRPLSALALGTRVLLECPLSAVPTSMVVRLVEARLRLLSWLPGRDLPGDVGRPHLLWRVIERFAVALSPHAAQLVAACHPHVADWLAGHLSEGAEHRRAYGRTHFFDGGDELPTDEEELGSRLEIAERLHAALRFEVPLRALLRFEHGGEVLKARGRGVWSQALVAYLDDPDRSIREAAEDAWVETSELEKLLPWLDWLPARLEHSQRHRQHLRTIVGLVSTAGTPLQQKEALLRAGLASVSFTYYDPRAEEHRSVRIGNYHHDPLGGALAHPFTAEALLPQWRLAWESGLLGVEGDPALEELYLRFLRDGVPAARWRAVRAMRLQEREQRRPQASGAKESGDAKERQRNAERMRAEARSLLQDPCRPVRIEAAMFLIECSQALSLAEFLPLCVSLHPPERWVGLYTAISNGVEPGLDYLLQALVPEDEPLAERGTRYGEDPRPALTRIEEAVRSHGEHARAKLLEWARARYSRPSHRTYLYEQLDNAQSGRFAEALLEENWSGNRKIPLEELRHLLDVGRQAQRRWTVERLYNSYGNDERSALLLSLVDDHDPEIAARARERAEHLREQARLEARRKEPPRPPPRAPVVELERAVMGFLPESSSRPASPLNMAEPFPLDKLGSYQSFESLWEALREHPLELDFWNTVDYNGRDERVEHIELLAGKARELNLERIRPVMQRLEELYQPQHRAALLKGLGHPLLGLWAELLLRREAPGRDLLTVIAEDEKAAVRVANIAKGTSLHAPVIDAFIDAISRGCLTTPSSDDSDAHARTSDPVWFSTFLDLAGLEGLIRLLQVPLGGPIRRLVLKHLDQGREKLQGQCSEAVRRKCLEWARTAAEEGSAPEQVVALHLITLLGERADALRWGQLLSERRIAEEVLVAALLMIAQHGEAQQADFLRQLVRENRGIVREAALGALVEHGGAADVHLYFSILEEREESEYPGQGFRYRWRDLWSPHPLADQALAGIVRHGSSDDALRLARLLLDEDNERIGQNRFGYVSNFESTALRTAATHGRLPEHALLVISALLHDPGDQEYAVNTEGFDEVHVQDSKVPHAVATAIQGVIARTSKESVRRAFLIASLWGGPSSIIARGELRHHGGPRPQDVPLLLAHLRQEPDSFMALSHLASIGRIERELVQIWSETQCAWWSAVNGDPKSLEFDR